MTHEDIADILEGHEEEDGLEVDVVAMGDDTDANFPAIYGDLFSDKTFDPSSGGWSYAVQDSYGLPEFDG